MRGGSLHRRARSNASREANQVLEWIQQMYDVEDRAADTDGRRASGSTCGSGSRCRSSIGSRDIWMSCRPPVLPKSTLGKALTYARNQRAALRQFVSDGRLTIDNNVSERTVRIQAIGRKVRL